MRFRWPLTWHSSYEWAMGGWSRCSMLFAEEQRKVADRDAEVEALRAEIREADEGLKLQSDEIERCHAELTALEAERDVLLSSPVVTPFWLGLPNHVLNLVVTTNMDGVQATLEMTRADESSDDPRRNPTLAFALRPL